MIRLGKVVLLAILTFVFHARSASGQAMIQVSGPNGETMMVPAGANPFGGQPPGGPPPGAKPGGEKKEAEGEKKEGDKKGEDPEPKVIRRGDQEFGDANPDELKASVGEDGRVAFEFKNQSWVTLIEWLARIADRPLDWQELPPDRVNIRAPGRYTVRETMDLFNRHLLARGYTLLDLAGGLTVVKTSGINPAMVPRVSASELAGLTPHTFVRTSLELGWLSSDKLAEELKPMISANGKLTALTTTNRIEAMDAAVNLQQIAQLLEQERDTTSREALAPEFKLRYISAENAKLLLQQFLGVEQKKQTMMTPQQMQMMQQMAQQGGQPQMQRKKTDISIVANSRQNSVFVRAPADRIAIAREFIKRIDVPTEDIVSLADVESRVEIYRLYSIDPEKLIEIIEDMNILEPSTRIRANEDDGTLFVSGSAADRFIIEKLIKRLDSSGRQFEVLQLRRLDATEVAESITFLMGKEKEDEDNNRSRGYFFYGGFGNQDEKKEKDEFRVAANARFQQVLLWANQTEMEQVRNLLVKLGELPPPGGSPRMVRRIEASSSPETYQYLLRLKRQWEQVSDSPLSLPDESEFVDPVAAVEGEEPLGDDDPLMSTPQTDSDDAPTEALAPEADSTTRSVSEPRLYLTGTDADEETEAPASPPATTKTPSSQIQSVQDFDRLFGTKPKEPAAKKPEGDNAGAPIQIGLDENGNLVLTGKDTKALDQLENMMLQVRPPRRPYSVFHIKHQSAGYVRLNLVEYFEDQEEESEADRFYRFWFDEQADEDGGPAGLGKNNELRFVYDPDTNTIVVSGATSSQLKTISELIELWDVPEPVNKRRMRFIKLVTLQYGRAEQIAETVKEACRDLLSSNDKAFAQRGGGGGGGGNPGSPGGGGGGEKSSGRESRGSGLAGAENGKDGGDVDFSFKGKLSIGIDSIGNTLLVSAEGEPLLDLVEDMILELDEAAKPAGDVRILSISGKTSSESVSNILQAFGGKAGPGKGAAAAQAKSNVNPAATPRG